ncbi:MAG: hypothetical protein MJ137_00835 [Clostridia bacterium]|nr:hypothetical protein [Clostridia bacterium]
MTFYLKNSGMGSESFEVLRKTAARKFEERELGVSEDTENAYVIELITDKSLKDDRYILSSGSDGCVLTAGNDRSLHAAFGRWLTESFADGKGGFEPYSGKMDFTPRDRLRGMYFATHFYNFYHAAPIEEVYEVIDDLALRGCNTVLVWFDMHHFTSMEDEGAVALSERLHALIKHANLIGIGGSLTMLANEAFAGSPTELRAEWNAVNGYFRKPEDHFHLEICPSKPGGIEEIIRERRMMLEKFRDLKIDYISYWPYDPGGCTCAECAPWGAGGFMKLYPAFRNLLSEMMPETRIIISTWYFDRFIAGEWDAFYKIIENGMPEGTDYIMSFFFGGNMPEILKKKGIPEGVKFIDFPEISMYRCSPWGGFGASCLPEFLEKTNEKSGALYCGGYPYSEGIFEDVNKYITLSYYSGQYMHAEDAVRAYVRTEFCVEGKALDELTYAVISSEKSLYRTKKKPAETLESTQFIFDDPEKIGEIYGIFSKYNAVLPEKIRTGRNFRIWYLRSVIDREIRDCGGFPKRSEICQRAFEELVRIYHAIPGKTHGWVCPPIGL